MLRVMATLSRLFPVGLLLIDLTDGNGQVQGDWGTQACRDLRITELFGLGFD